MKIRTATEGDFQLIDKLYKSSDFHLSFGHIKSVKIVEDDKGEVIAVGVINEILEATFLANEKTSKKSRVKALLKLEHEAYLVARKLEFESYHAFCAPSSSIVKILLNKFHFVRTVSEVLIKWV